MDSRTAILIVSAVVAVAGTVAVAQNSPLALDQSSNAQRGDAGGIRRERGPSDAEIALRVQQQLTQQIAAPGVSAEIVNGVATLRGTVGTENERDRAAQTARRVDGVTRVKNEIVVNAQAAAAHADAHDVPPIDVAVKSKLKEDVQLKDESIDVRERNSIVTLTGRVTSIDEKEQAGKLAAEVAGVSEVHNRLDVR
jgi:osmotically-inducible protein OsmY